MGVIRIGRQPNGKKSCSRLDGAYFLLAEALNIRLVEALYYHMYEKGPMICDDAMALRSPPSLTYPLLTRLLEGGGEPHSTQRSKIFLSSHQDDGPRNSVALWCDLWARPYAFYGVHEGLLMNMSSEILTTLKEELKRCAESKRSASAVLNCTHLSLLLLDDEVHCCPTESVMAPLRGRLHRTLEEALYALMRSFRTLSENPSTRPQWAEGVEEVARDLTAARINSTHPADRVFLTFPWRAENKPPGAKRHKQNETKPSTEGNGDAWLNYLAFHIAQSSKELVSSGTTVQHLRCAEMILRQALNQLRGRLNPENEPTDGPSNATETSCHPIVTRCDWKERLKAFIYSTALLSMHDVFVTQAADDTEAFILNARPRSAYTRRRPYERKASVKGVGRSQMPGTTTMVAARINALHKRLTEFRDKVLELRVQGFTDWSAAVASGNSTVATDAFGGSTAAVASLQTPRVGLEQMTVLTRLLMKCHCVED